MRWMVHTSGTVFNWTVLSAPSPSAHMPPSSLKRLNMRVWMSHAIKAVFCVIM